MKFLKKLRNLNDVIAAFSLTEKIIFGVFVVVLAGSTLSLLVGLNTNFLVNIPTRGGILNEGVVGTARFINPVLAVSDVDQDLTSLVYSGLMRIDEKGELIQDLAESHEVSKDGLSYTFTIRNDATFHDGKNVTADDIVFTIKTIQDPAIKSPYRGNWDGISVEKVSHKKIKFHLKEAYSPFIWNTTIGILPHHIWKGVSTDEFAFNSLNTDPIGSGAYEVSEIERNQSGIVTKYIMESFKNFTLNEPYIETIRLFIYNNDEERMAALADGSIEAVVGVMPEDAKKMKDRTIVTFPLSRIFAIFLNPNHDTVLAQSPVRRALDVAIDKEGLIEEVLGGYGEVEHSPIPSSLFDYDYEDTSEKDKAEHIASAAKILADAGWKKNSEGILMKDKASLRLSLATNNISELTSVAEYVIGTWKELGVDVDVEVFESADLRQNVIRPREYDALLFGEIVGPDLDVYAFWHSSQRNDPGLNIASYVNIDVDALLKDIRKLSDEDERNEKIEKFIKEVNADTPAIFLYSPSLIYIVPQKLNGVSEHAVLRSADRFNNVYKWHIERDKVWKIFN